MLFNSYYFVLIFLPLVWCGYFGLNQIGKYKPAQIFLVAASLFFYGYYNWYYLGIICVSIVINYVITKSMGDERFDRHRTKILALGIVFNVGLLLYFKYTNFFVDNINALFHTGIMVKKILLPLGISFYTFQQIGFLADVYRTETRGLKLDFWDYAEFVAFFPQLVAGPIASKDLIEQMKDPIRRKADPDHVAAGLMLFAVGLFKKVLIADTFSRGVNWGFSNVAEMNSIEAIIVMLSYTFQIYFDFSGYSDMALGLAEMFNFELPVNFNAPYRACSIVEFWQRWHMTLTTFLQKNIYIPLGGKRKGRARTCLNVLIVFLISGFWHGANWTFVVWGLLHGVASVLNRLFRRQWERLHAAVRWVCTFLFVNVTWIIFRADSMRQAWQFIGRIFTGGIGRVSELLVTRFPLIESEVLNVSLAQHYAIWAFLLFGFASMFNARPYCTRQFKPSVYNCLGTMILLVWSVLSLAGRSEFIYFGF